MLKAIALLANMITTPAYAQIPSELRGDWCDVPGSTELFMRCPKNATPRLIIDLRGYAGMLDGEEEYGCDLKQLSKITRFNPPYRYALTFECVTENVVSIQEEIWQRQKAELSKEIYRITFPSKRP